jgi:hypothetical protein
MYELSFSTRYDYSAFAEGIEVEVTLSYGESSQRLIAKVDTGASFCIFQREYAEAIGIAVETGQRRTFSTAGGPFSAYGHTIQMNCLGHTNESVAYFSEQYGFVRNVLGRQGWLNRHRLAIVDHDGLIYLSGYNDPVV